MPTLERKITKKVVDGLPHPKKGQVLYFDPEIRGFGVRLTPTKKTYFAQRDVAGKTKRITIGPHGVFTPEQARSVAKEILFELANGIDRREERKKKEAEDAVKNLTLEQAFEQFSAARPGLSEKTLKDYRLSLKKLGVPREYWPKRGMPEQKWQHVDKGWWRKPVRNITKKMVSEEHKRLGRESGDAYANLAMRALSSVMNFLGQEYEDEEENSLFPVNPVSKLTRTRSWFDVPERDTWVHWDQLPVFWKTINGFVRGIEDRTAIEWSVRDYLLFVLLYGARRNEMMRLRWDEVDLERGSLHIPGMRTKNGQPLYLPLPDFLWELLLERENHRDCEWVFGGKKYKTKPRKHLVEPRNYIELLGAAMGNDFKIHDLRRTFVNTARKLKISVFDIKEIVNHKARKKRHSDITYSYSVLDSEELREPIQMICDFYLDKMGVK